MRGIFLLLFVFKITGLHSQSLYEQYQYSETSYSISYEYVEVVEYSYKFSYGTSGSYSTYAPSVNYAQAMATLQARYDYYHAIISSEYYKLKDFKLVNKTNSETLAEYKKQRLDWVYNSASTVDLSNPTVSNQIINYCCEIYSYTAIKNEIQLLKAINREIKRLQTEKPGEYHKTERYKELGTVLNKLATCSTDEISKLAWEYGLNW